MLHTFVLCREDTQIILRTFCVPQPHISGLSAINSANGFYSKVPVNNANRAKNKPSNDAIQKRSEKICVSKIRCRRQNPASFHATAGTAFAVYLRLSSAFGATFGSQKLFPDMRLYRYGQYHKLDRKILYRYRRILQPCVFGQCRRAFQRLFFIGQLSYQQQYRTQCAAAVGK